MAIDPNAAVILPGQPGNSVNVATAGAVISDALAGGMQTLQADPTLATAQAVVTDFATTAIEAEAARLGPLGSITAEALAPTIINHLVSSLFALARQMGAEIPTELFHVEMWAKGKLGL